MQNYNLNLNLNSHLNSGNVKKKLLILDQQDYESENLRQLSKTMFYEKLKSNPLPQFYFTSTFTHDTLNHLFQMGLLTKAIVYNHAC